MGDKLDGIFEDKRADFKVNHQNIVRAYSQFIDDNGYPPTKTQVADITGLHINTICNHMKELERQDLSEIVGDFKVLTRKVITNLFKETNQGNVPASKLFLQVVHDWGEKQRFEGDMKLDKKIDLDYDKLSDDEAETLYKLIEKAKKENE